MSQNDLAALLISLGAQPGDVGELLGEDDPAALPALLNTPGSVATTPPMVAFDVPAQDINDNGNLNLGTAVRADAGWSSPAAHQAQFTGTPDRVRLSLNVRMTGPGTIARAEPRIAVASSGGGSRESLDYIRDATGNEDGSITIAWTDHAPGTNPVYTFTTTQGSSEPDPVNVIAGISGLELEAVS